MKKTISKSISLVLISVLMMFCVFFFTACGNNSELETDISKLEDKVATLETQLSQANAKLTQTESNLATANGKITETENKLTQTQNEFNAFKAENGQVSKKGALEVLRNVRNYMCDPSSYSLNGMETVANLPTTYAGIKAWKYVATGYTSPETMDYKALERQARLVEYALDNKHFNINEDYQILTLTNGVVKSNYGIKIEMSENEMIVRICVLAMENDSLIHKQANAFYVTFTDSFDIKTIVAENYMVQATTTINLFVFSNSQCSYSIDSTSALGQEFITSVEAEFSKPCLEGEVAMDSWLNLI